MWSKKWGSRQLRAFGGHKEYHFICLEHTQGVTDIWKRQVATSKDNSRLRSLDFKQYIKRTHQRSVYIREREREERKGGKRKHRQTDRQTYRSPVQSWDYLRLIWLFGFVHTEGLVWARHGTRCWRLWENTDRTRTVSDPSCLLDKFGRPRKIKELFLAFIFPYINRPVITGLITEGKWINEYLKNMKERELL